MVVPQTFPEGSWLRYYLDSLARVTEAPWIFHILGGLTCMGTAFGRDLRLPWADYAIYPPMNVLFLGPSGCGKTQAMNILLLVARVCDAADMARRKEAEDELHIIKNESTRQALIYRIGSGEENVRALQQRRQVIPATRFIIAAGEMKTFFNARKESEGLIETLTDMMDNPPDYQRDTIGRGREFVYQPTPTIVACSTVEWMLDNMPVNIFEGGFMSRVLPTLTRAKARIQPIPKLLDKRELSQLGASLAKLRQRIGPRTFQLKGPALKWYVEWYTELHDGVGSDRRLQGWIARKHVHLLRIAMLLWASEQHGKVHITAQLSVKHLKLANRILDNVQPSIEVLLRMGGSTPFGHLRQQVESIIQYGGSEGIARSDLLSQMSCSLSTFDEVIDTLKSARRIRVEGTRGEEPRYVVNKRRRAK